MSMFDRIRAQLLARAQTGNPAPQRRVSNVALNAYRGNAKSAGIFQQLIEGSRGPNYTPEVAKATEPAEPFQRRLRNMVRASFPGATGIMGGPDTAQLQKPFYEGMRGPGEIWSRSWTFPSSNVGLGSVIPSRFTSENSEDV